MLDHLRNEALNAGHAAAQAGDAAFQIPGQEGAFALAHLQHHVQGGAQGGGGGGPKLLGLGNFLGRLHHAGQAGEQIQGDVILQGQFLAQAAEVAGVRLGQGQIHPGFRGDAGSALDGHAHGDPPAGNAAVDVIANLGFEDFQVARQVDGDFGLLAVDGADLDGDFEAVPCAFAPPITGHGFHLRDYGQPARRAPFFFQQTSPGNLGDESGYRQSCLDFGGNRWFDRLTNAMKTKFLIISVVLLATVLGYVAGFRAGPCCTGFRAAK